MRIGVVGLGIVALLVLADVAQAQATLIELSLAVQAFCYAWKAFASIFGSVKEVTFQKVVNLGFNHFSETTQVLKLLNVSHETEGPLINGIMKTYKIPEDQRGAMFLMEYTLNSSWTGTTLIYSPNKDNTYKSLAVYRSGDLETKRASYLVVDVAESFQLAPDILVKHTHTSILGGIFSSDKYEYSEFPHDITLDDAKILMDFFTLSVATAIKEVLPPPTQ